MLLVPCPASFTKNILSEIVCIFAAVAEVSALSSNSLALIKVKGLHLLVDGFHPVPHIVCSDAL